MHDLLPLHLLPAGTQARIGQLLGQADEVHRLEELGMRVGRRVEMVQAGTPCIVKLDGARFCFRDCDAFRVLVLPGEAT
jgi:Fe2+ transport system protein FeoA